MSVSFINRNFFLTFLKSRRAFATSVASVSEEYTETPQYPPILDLSLDKQRERKIQAWADEIQAVKTVEEKQIKLNMPRYYGFPCYVVHEDVIPYDSLRLTQHITRTHLIKQKTLPDCYNKLDTDNLATSLKDDIEEAILLEYGKGYRRSDEIHEAKLTSQQLEDTISSSLCVHINRALLNNLCSSQPHLKDTQVDLSPRVESFWYAGGMDPPELIQKMRRGNEWQKHRAKEPTDRAVQYIGTPSLALRSELPLPPVVPYSEAENASFEVPLFKYDPRVIYTSHEIRRFVNTPGFWPGDPYLFGLMSYHNRGHLLSRDFTDAQDNKEALHRQGILASFGWLNAQANFLGFTTYNDITYPLVTQCVVTNGQLWSFFVYQLNTVLMHSKYATENSKRNICWATGELKLFEEVADGKVVGLNDDVLKLLVKFYANAPQERVGVEMRPYLSKEEKVIADYKDDDKRQWLEREYKFITSNRPRSRLPYEVYHWEKIYKIDHKTRPYDSPKRPFEQKIKPLKRRYDERLPQYIPRKFRPDVPRHVGRYVKEYFP